MPISSIALGAQFGRLTVLREVCSPGRGRKRVFECACTCGNTKKVELSHLNSGSVTSCGCYNRETASRTHTKHGMYKDPLYSTWIGIISRCTNPQHEAWRHYGGRGILVCERWRDFCNFRNDVGKRPSPKHSLDRHPDPNGNYEPGNVRWATQRQQMRNTRQNIWIEFKGERRLLIEVCEELGLPRHVVAARRQRHPEWGWENLFRPVWKGLTSWPTHLP